MVLHSFARKTYTPLEPTLEANVDHSAAASDESHCQPYGNHYRRRFLIALIFNVALIFLIATGYATSWKRRSALVSLRTPVPDLPNEVRTFKLDPLYLSLPNQESDAAWAELPGPNGMALINLNDTDQSRYPDTRAGLSVFHQLHCLGALRKFMWELIYDKHDRRALLQTWPQDVTSPTYDEAIHGLWHYAHCFDYLRQGLQCASDMSLEFVSDNTGLAVIDGLDWPHVCKSWNAVWEYARVNGGPDANLAIPNS